MHPDDLRSRKDPCSRDGERDILDDDHLPGGIAVAKQIVRDGFSQDGDLGGGFSFNAGLGWEANLDELESYARSIDLRQPQVNIKAKIILVELVEPELRDHDRTGDPAAVVGARISELRGPKARLFAWASGVARSVVKGSPASR